MLDLAILGLLKEGPMHGYELKKQLSGRLGSFWSVSFGSLYPTLKKLARSGMVERVTSPTESRRKQVYRITDEGEAEFLRLLEEGTGVGEGRSGTVKEDETFSVRLAFFRFVGPNTRIRLLERRREYLEEKLAGWRRRLEKARDRGADPYTRALMEHNVASIEADIAWLNDLITAERSPRTSDSTAEGGPAPPPGSQPPNEESPETESVRSDAAPSHRATASHATSDRTDAGRPRPSEPSKE